MAISGTLQKIYSVEALKHEGLFVLTLLAPDKISILNTHW
jgi:hypothetical protein